MNTTVVNYDGSISASPQQIAYPGSVDELQTILRDAKRYPSPVRAMGSYHSLTPCASSDGTIISMSRMNGILEIDPKGMSFTAQAGLHHIEASRALRARNLQFFNNVEIGNLTMGAAACCHTKDGLDGAEFGQISSYVTKIKWVTPSGELAEASESGNPDLLRLVRSSHGLCGVIYEVTLRIKPLEAIHFNYLPRPIKDLTQNEVDDIFAKSRGLVCWTIGRLAVFQTRTNASSVYPSGTLCAAIRRRLWNHTEAGTARLIDRCVPTKPLKDAALDAWFAGSRTIFRGLHLAGGFSLWDPDKIVDYRSTPTRCKYAFTFWSFPAAKWLGALKDYVEFADEHFKTYGFRCNMALGSYYVRKDTHSALSYSHDGDMFSLDPIHACIDQAQWDAFLNRFNEFAFARGGVPLLNQTPHIERRDVEAGYGQRWREFSAWVKTVDPGQRMLNPFFAGLLATEPANPPPGR